MRTNSIIKKVIGAVSCVMVCEGGMLFFWGDDLKLVPWNFWEINNSFLSIKVSVGSSQKVKGYSLVEGPLSEWAENNLFDGWYVLLHDINTEFLAPRVWVAMPNETRRQFLQDVVVLHCRDSREAFSIFDSIEVGFAKAHIINHGILYA